LQTVYNLPIGLQSNMSTSQIDKNHYFNLEVVSVPTSVIDVSVYDEEVVLVIDEAVPVEPPALVDPDNFKCFERRNAHKRPLCIPESLTNDILRSDKSYTPKYIRKRLYSEHGKTVLTNKELGLLEGHRIYLRKQNPAPKAREAQRQAEKRVRGRETARLAKEARPLHPLSPIATESNISTNTTLLTEPRKMKEQWRIAHVQEEELLTQVQEEKRLKHARMAPSRALPPSPSSFTLGTPQTATKTFLQVPSRATSSAAISGALSPPKSDKSLNLEKPKAKREKLRSEHNPPHLKEQAWPVSLLHVREIEREQTSLPATPATTSKTLSVGQAPDGDAAAAYAAAAISLEAIRASIPAACSLHLVSPTVGTTSESRRGTTQRSQVLSQEHLTYRDWVKSASLGQFDQLSDMATKLAMSHKKLTYLHHTINSPRVRSPPSRRAIAATIGEILEIMNSTSPAYNP
jgi:hypothetical protein